MDTGLAREIANLWSLDQNIAMVSQNDPEHSVFAVRQAGETCFLRLYDPAWSSLADIDAEIGFVAHLSGQGVRVSEPIRSSKGRMVEGLGYTAAAMFRLAPGQHVEPSDPEWNEALFRDWGRTIARHHEAARTFPVPTKTWRADWHLEPLLREGLDQIEKDDTDLAREAHTLLSELERHVPEIGEVGMVHADHAPQNFRYDLEAGITTFDFANCCRHWFLHDIAIAVYSVQRAPNFVGITEWIMDGYRELMPLPGEISLLPFLLRMRILYVYCDRLKRFGNSPDAVQITTLLNIRNRFMAKSFNVA